MAQPAMARSRRPSLDLSESAQVELIAGARDSQRVQGLTHTFYKYPARFSPAFVRAAIKAFTRPSDLVLDNHVGGGTTLVEALAMGRHAIGVDISTLAEFVASVKTTVFEDAELKQLARWAEKLSDIVHMHRPSPHFANYAELGYYRHLDHPSRWRLRKAIEQGLAAALQLNKNHLASFGRCVVLRTAQWALDGRKEPPTVSEFREVLIENAKDMLEGTQQLQAAVGSHRKRPKAYVINRSAVGLEQDAQIRKWPAPRLVLTSPPYPGIHVLYHRWQIDGGKEAPLPFMIANRLDGSGESYYTMGSRKQRGLQSYFDSICASMSSIAALADDKTLIVQMVAFSNPRGQLPRYLRTMEKAGLREVFLPKLKNHADGRLWRSVPGRRWYSDQRGMTPGSQEVVLIHQKAKATQPRPLDRSDPVHHQLGRPNSGSSVV